MTNSAALQKNRRPILLVVGLGILLMLVSTLSYLSGNPSLVIQNAPQEMASAGAQSDGMNTTQQEALMELMQRLKESPNDSATLISLAEHFLHTGELARAENFALRAVVAAPSESRPLYLLGIIQHNQNRHTEAAASLEKVLAIKNDPSVHYSLGMLYAYYLNKVEQGIAELQKVLDDPNAPTELKTSVAEEIKKAEEHSKHAQ